MSAFGARRSGHGGRWSLLFPNSAEVAFDSLVRSAPRFMQTGSRPTIAERFALERLELRDVETLRHILRGGSVVDWKRLHFRTRDEVDHFLRLNLFDPDSTTDRERLRDLLRQSVEYLRKTFKYRVAAPVAKPKEIHDLFLIASGVAEPKRYRRIACVVLKVMHTVHHVEARELLFRARISEVDLAQMLDARVREVLERLRDQEGVAITGFIGSMKSRESLITKLLAKRDNLATQVYDRLRYRIVVRRRRDLFPVVLGLAEELFPFNYVIPGQTQNSLISIERLLRERPDLFEEEPDLRAHAEVEDEPAGGVNEFSGRSYRILNFIVDLPLRMDATALAARADGGEDLGSIVFAPVELQVLDEATLERNESGENAHARYKHRQLRRVLSRMARGLVVPKGTRRARQESGEK